jgi:hypothetical protein
VIRLIKSGDDSRRNWRTINEISTSLNRLELPDQSRDAGLAGLRQRNRDFAAFPFQIYQTGTLKYKVRDGLVIITDAPAIIPTGLETELTSPGGADYWIVCDLTTTTAVVSGTASSPVFSTEKIPIGWIDSEGAIHQFLHDNIFSPCVTTEAPP